jgi:hypothetical protein
VDLAKDPELCEASLALNKSDTIERMVAGTRFGLVEVWGVEGSLADEGDEKHLLRGGVDASATRPMRRHAMDGTQSSYAGKPALLGRFPSPKRH